MQPTPTPSSPPTKYPSTPQNIGSAPFRILVELFISLQSERRQARRKWQLLDTWFNYWRDEDTTSCPSCALFSPRQTIKLIPLGTGDPWPDAQRSATGRNRPRMRKPRATFRLSFAKLSANALRSSRVPFPWMNSTTFWMRCTRSINFTVVEIRGQTGRTVQNTPAGLQPHNTRRAALIVRIILKDMVLSAKETTVFSVFHPNAQDLYNTCSDLKKVAWELWDPSHRHREEDRAVKLCSPFAPMLCKRPTKTIEDTVKAMAGLEFIMEEKLDGERMQLHKRGKEYFYWSRKGKDYTYLYGNNAGTGSLTPYIDQAFDEGIEDIILDGEMLVWDPVSQRNLPFGTLKPAALDKSKKEHNPRPCFKVFDLLYLNGRSLIENSTQCRKNILERCLREIQGRIEYAVQSRGKTAQDVRKRMDEVMAARGEGLVIKHPGAQYVLNGRNTDWIKVKPEYLDDMGETVDVLVVAGNYGSGSRGGGVSTLICAVLDDRCTDEEDKYRSFVRIGTGLTYADYVWIRAKPWKTWDPKNPPHFLQTAAKSHEDKGDVYLRPKDSFILKVRAAQIVESDKYHLGYTLRFPRALCIRDDLRIDDCMPATAVFDSVRTVKKRKMHSDESAGRPSNKKSKAAHKAEEYQNL